MPSRSCQTADPWSRVSPRSCRPLGVHGALAGLFTADKLAGGGSCGTPGRALSSRTSAVKSSSKCSTRPSQSTACRASGISCSIRLPSSGIEQRCAADLWSHPSVRPYLVDFWVRVVLPRRRGKGEGGTFRLEAPVRRSPHTLQKPISCLVLSACFTVDAFLVFREQIESISRPNQCRKGVLTEQVPPAGGDRRSTSVPAVPCMLCLSPS